MRNPEPTTLGISSSSHVMLAEMSEDDGDFRQMMDGYRFAVALAIAQGGIAETLTNGRTIYGVSSLDPDRVLFNTVEVLLGEAFPEDPIYKIVERLAEWGIQEMYSSRVNGEIDLGTLMPS